MHPRLAPYAVPLAVLVATVAVRALIALSRWDELDLEFYSGNLAWAWLHGMPLDPERLPIINHLRGSVIFAVLAMPLFALLGNTLAALKVLAVLWSGLSAFLLALVLERAAGRRAAWIGGLLFAFAPPAQQMVEVMALGSHADTLPFFLAPLAILLRRRVGQPLSTWGSLHFGFWIGAGLLFSMQVWVALIGVLAMWLHTEPRLFRSPRPLLVAAAAAPSLLLVPLLSRTGELVNRPLNEWLLLAEPSSKLAKALGYELRRAWLYEEVGTAWVSWWLFAALTLGFAWLLARLPWRSLLPWSPRALPHWALLGTFALLHTAALFSAYTVLDFQVNLVATGDGMGSRYFMPLLPALLIPLALALARLGQSRRRLADGLAAALVASAAAGLVPMLQPGTFSALPRTLGTELHYFRNHLEHAGGSDLGARLAWIARLSPHWAHAHPLAYDQAFPFHGDHTDRETAAEARVVRIRLVPEPWRPYLFASLGVQTAEQWLFASLSRQTFRIDGPTLQQLQALALTLEPEERRWFARGLGRSLAALGAGLDLQAFTAGVDLEADDPIRATYRMLADVHPDLLAYVAQGMGFQVGSRLSPYKRRYLRALGAAGAVPELAQEPFWNGVGWGYRMRFDEARYRSPGPLRIEAGLERASREALRRGLDWTGPLDRD